MTDKPALPEVLSTERIYEGRVFDVEHASIRFPDGVEAERETVRHPGAVALVALVDDDLMLLVEQYRHPARKRLLEVPAGTREPGEAPEVTARRELREETGYDATELVRLGGAWMAPGFTSEYIDFYLARGLFEAPLLTGDEEDLGAPIAITLDELDSAIAAGHIEDAKTIVARHLYDTFLRTTFPAQADQSA